MGVTVVRVGGHVQRHPVLVVAEAVNRNTEFIGVRGRRVQLKQPPRKCRIEVDEVIALQPFHFELKTLAVKAWTTVPSFQKALPRFLLSIP